MSNWFGDMPDVLVRIIEEQEAQLAEADSNAISISPNNGSRTIDLLVDIA